MTCRWPSSRWASRHGYAGTTLETFTSAREGRILLRRLPTLAEVADVAALMASDRASAMTATIANVTCGEMLD